MDPPVEFMSSSLSNDNVAVNDFGQFSFVTTTHQNDDISGTMQVENSELGGNNTKSELKYSVFDNRIASTLLGTKGVGWLLEVEDSDDETFDKPLL